MENPMFIQFSGIDRIVHDSAVFCSRISDIGINISAPQTIRNLEDKLWQQDQQSQSTNNNAKSNAKSQDINDKWISHKITSFS